MSTTFGVRIPKTGELVEVAFRSKTIIWENPLAPLLHDDTEVEPLNNTAQGIYTIGDIKDAIVKKEKRESIDEVVRYLELFNERRRDDEVVCSSPDPKELGLVIDKAIRYLKEKQMKYNNDFKYDLKVGQAKEEELGEIFNSKTIEVKYDLQALKTNNVYVEYSSRGKPSGISKSVADFYCFCFGDTFHLIATTVLKERCRKYLNSSRDKKGGDSNTSKGVLLPLKELLQTYMGSGWEQRLIVPYTNE